MNRIPECLARIGRRDCDAARLVDDSVGAALIAAREGKQDPFDAITAVIPWDRFRASVVEAGDYVWSRARQRTVNAEGYRLLRTASEAALPAA